MVPNHMGADLTNRWWKDVLEHGPASRYAPWFDIDYKPRDESLHDKVILPILEQHYAKVLEAGKLRLVFDEVGFGVAYHDRKLPLAPDSCCALLNELTAALDGTSRHSEQGDADRNVSFVEVAGRSPSITKTLEKVKHAEPKLRKVFYDLIGKINGRPGSPQSFDALHALIQQQHYRLAFWRTGLEEINYRRFFDVPELVSLRMELSQVFQATHQLVFQLVREGRITGLRIDHPDGLWDPKQYLQRLVKACRTTKDSKSASRPYIVAEKILVGDECLPSDWPIEGTTGYDFLNRVNGLFVNSSSRIAFDDLYREFTGQSSDFPALVYTCKKQVLENSFQSEVNSLTSMLKRLAASSRYGQDFTFRQLRVALVELIAAFPVYRTYLDEEKLSSRCLFGGESPPGNAATSAVYSSGVEAIGPSGDEREYISQALMVAKNHNRVKDPNALKFIANLLQLQFPSDLTQNGRQHAREFVMRLQQLTGPVMAKGFEDTALYNFNRLISLNEVGSSPDRFGSTVEEFHAYNLHQAKHWPHTLLATATHDTKRGEDARMRIDVLSEMPMEWREAVLRWQRLNAQKKPVIKGEAVPDHNDEYLLYQALVGAWLAQTEMASGLKSFAERIAAYALKASRESKRHTSWTEPNAAYEEGTRKFVMDLLAHSSSNGFLKDFKQFHTKISFFGALNSLAQVLIKLTAPGVPDFYQGSELWDLSLVDPDNRRPVDFELRRQMLVAMENRLKRQPMDMPQFLSDLMNEINTGESKLYLIWRVLNFRKAHRQLFDKGSYMPLSVTGPKHDHGCAFARVLDDQVAITVVPRLILGLTGGVIRPPLGREVWEGTVLRVPIPGPNKPSKDSRRFHNLLTQESIVIPQGQEEVNLGDVLGQFPVALLHSD
jgi:(1->4)-alpha-D-glucan 1-alpha-D-glucosylmutase